MNSKILAVAIVILLAAAGIGGAIILTMGDTTGNRDRSGDPDDEDAGDAPLDQGSAIFVITSLNVSAHHVLTDFWTTLTVDVKNNGTADGTYVMNVTLDGEVIRTRSVFIGMDNSTTQNYSISSPDAGNHTIGVGNASTYLNCYDFYEVGSYMTYSSLEVDEILGTMQYNYTLTYISQNATTYTVNLTYEDDVYPAATYLYNKTGESESDRENLTFLGMTNITTAFGEKELAHYAYTIDNNGYHFEVDTYLDERTGATFRTVMRTDGFTLTDELIDTNRVWMKEI